MKNLFYGENYLALNQAVTDIINSIEPNELKDVNFTKLDIVKTSYDDFVISTSAIPFMVNKRIIIVQNLISNLEKLKNNHSNNNQTNSWNNLPKYLKNFPATTHLVVIEEAIKIKNNNFIQKILDEFQIKNFRAPSIQELPEWIMKRAEVKNISIDFKIAKAISDAVGVNLRIIDSELEKLSLYTNNITEKDVEKVVSHATDPNIFHAVDALLDNNKSIALKHIKELFIDGKRASYIINMITRQLRLILFAKHYYNIGYNESRIGSLLSLRGYPLRKILEQNLRINREILVEIYSQLIKLDTSLKTSNIDEEFALEIFISGLRV